MKSGEKNGVVVDEEFFHCPGHFFLLHKNRPNDEDVKAIKEFAKKIISRE